MDRIEEKILKIIDENADKIIAFGDDIWHHAELGYMEKRTGKKFAEALEGMGLSCNTELAVTGVKSHLKPYDKDRVNVALMGELDALPFADHIDANPETGAAHCCGHNAQLTGVMGAAIALTDPEIKRALGGNITFIGVPAEENCSGSVDNFNQLKADGKVEFQGGKAEFIRLGLMDDVDMTVGHHTVSSDFPGVAEYVVCNGASMGFIEKYITYTGISQHPAFANKSIDALSAATLAMHGVDLQREAINHWESWNTHILHGYIKNGGTASNVISSNVEMDYNIRGKTTRAMLDIGYRVDRALKGAAIATGAGLEVRTEPGYLPLVPVKDASVVSEVFDIIDPDKKHTRDIIDGEKLAGTTDYGDLSSIMPVIQFNTAGVAGQAHTSKYAVKDMYEYYVVPAKCFALLAYRLLKDDAAKAKQIIAENKPLYTKEEYLALREKLSKTEKMDMVPVPETFE